MLKVIKLESFKIDNFDEIESFILSNKSNGEFINSLNFLSYHPSDRFVDDSIVIVDESTNKLVCIFMAATTLKDPQTIISHPGTTFAGPIISKKANISQIENIISSISFYYLNKYNKIEIKLPPSFYNHQFIEEINYFLLKNGFIYSFNALSNVINLTSLERSDNYLLNLYDQKRRNQVRKTLKEELYIVEKKEIIDRALWANMDSKVFEKFNSNLTHSYEEILHLKNLYPSNIEFYVCNRINDEYGALAVIFKFKNVFHTQYLDLNYNLSKEYPNLFLIHHLIDIAVNERFDYFSFGSSTENRGTILNNGLYNYKKGYGSGSSIMPIFVKNKE